MLTTRVAGPRLPSSRPFVREGSGQSTRITRSKDPGARSHRSTRAAPGRNPKTSGTGWGPASVTGTPARRRLSGLELGEQFLDLRGVGHGAVRAEDQRWRDAEGQVVAEPVVDEPPGALQRCQRGFPLL